MVVAVQLNSSAVWVAELHEAAAVVRVARRDVGEGPARAAPQRVVLQLRAARAAGERPGEHRLEVADGLRRVEERLGHAAAQKVLLQPPA